MKKSLLFLLFLAVSVSGASASKNAPDTTTVYLKDGTTMRGVIEAFSPRDSVTIKTSEGNTLTYYREDIHFITLPKDGGQNRHKGYMGIVELGYGFCLTESFTALNRIQAAIINGYRFNSCFYAGIGIGYTSTHTAGNRAGYNSLPLYLHLRTDLIDRSVTPYFSMNIGYNLKLNSKISDFDKLTGGFKGLMLEPTVGISFKVIHNHSCYLGLGYVWNEIIPSRSGKSVSFLAIKAGYTF